MRSRFKGLSGVQPFGILILIFSLTAFLKFAEARPSAGKGRHNVQNFLRQTNAISNVEFFYTNRGVLFNSGSKAEGLFWPRGSNVSYIFGGGLWFATKKIVGGRRRKLCEMGFDPDSGRGWFMEGDSSQVGLNPGTDGADPAAKYISYVSSRYDRVVGKFIQGSSSAVPAPFYAWPLWDTASTKILKRNFYFGDYISDVQRRTSTSLRKNGAPALPAIISEEDIVNIYSDADPTNNPEFKAGTGYPFGVDIQEVIYSWSFGQYRDMLFVRWKVRNTTADTLSDCLLTPAFDPDINYPDPAGMDDGNSYVSDSLAGSILGQDTALLYSQLHLPNHSLSSLNMAYQYHNGVMRNGLLGNVGFSLLEGTVIDYDGNIVPNDDSTALGGYGGTNSLFADTNSNHGLVTVRKWTIDNDPKTQDLRYDFAGSNQKDAQANVRGDLRLLLGTWPCTLLPSNSAEITICISFADGKDPKTAFHNLLLETDFAHEFFGQVDSVNIGGGEMGYFVNHFQSASGSVPNQKSSSGRSVSCFPNPFATSTAVHYSLPHVMTVHIVIADLLGRVVKKVFEGSETAGDHTFQVSNIDLPNATYVLEILGGDQPMHTQITHLR